MEMTPPPTYNSLPTNYNEARGSLSLLEENQPPTYEEYLAGTGEFGEDQPPTYGEYLAGTDEFGESDCCDEYICCGISYFFCFILFCCFLFVILGIFATVEYFKSI